MMDHIRMRLASAWDNLTTSNISLDRHGFHRRRKPWSQLSRREKALNMLLLLTWPSVLFSLWAVIPYGLLFLAALVVE